MRIGKQDQPFSAICTSDAHSITVRGKDLCGDIIGQFDFSSYFWFWSSGCNCLVINSHYLILRS